MTRLRKAQRAAMLEALKEAACWNRADIRAFNDISPSMSMLRERAKVLREAIKLAEKVKP